jgi:hypothetical protein
MSSKKPLRNVIAVGLDQNGKPRIVFDRPVTIYEAAGALLRSERPQ